MVGEEVSAAAKQRAERGGPNSSSQMEDVWNGSIELLG